MTNRVSSHHAWSQETNLRLKNPRVKRQLGSTSAGWITPLQLHQSRPPSPAYSTQASSKASTRLHSGRKAATRPNSRASESYSRLDSRLQSSSAASLRSVSLGTFSKPLKLAPRSQSSQGFQSKWSTVSRPSSGSITPPQGFDLASYIKQNGSARGIVIGRNGQPTSDNYFDAYLTQCESELFTKQTEIDSEESSSNMSETSDSAARRHQSVPLCWEEQLALSEPEYLRYVSPTPLRNSVQTSAPNGQQQFMNNLKVKLMLNNRCLLDTTCVKFLQESATILPNQDTSTIAEEQSPNQCHILDILLYGLNQHAQQELEKQTFEVCIVKRDGSGTGESVSVFKDLTARRLLKYVSVIKVHLDVVQTGRMESLDSQLSSVTVVYGKQRLLLFSAQLQSYLDSPLERVSTQPSCNGFAKQLHSQLLETQMKEKSHVGTPDIPEKFFHKRTSYCNQEDDEDRTDIALISSYLPELRLTEHEEISSPSHATLVATVHNNDPTLTGPTPLCTSVPHSGNKRAPKIIIVPSASEKCHPGSMQYTCGEKENEKMLDSLIKHYQEDESGAFTTITNSWIGQYFQ